jgi:hypothetical protein
MECCLFADATICTQPFFPQGTIMIFREIAVFGVLYENSKIVSCTPLYFFIFSPNLFMYISMSLNAIS